VWQLRTKKVRDRLHITEDQFQEIKRLSSNVKGKSFSEIESELRSILEPEQLDQAYRLQIAADLKRLGTVKTLCFGLVGDFLGFTEDESDRIFEQGKEIAQQLALDLDELKLESLHGALQHLSESKRELIAEMIGEALVVVPD
jgi:hypothetical protein